MIVTGSPSTASIVVPHAPDVGSNLLDHLVVPLGFDVPERHAVRRREAAELVNYLVRRRGMLTSNVGEAYGFVKSRPDLELPDLELIFAPAPYFDEGIGDPYDRPRRRDGADSAQAAQPAAPSPCARPTRRTNRSSTRRYLTDDAGADRAALMAGLRMCATIAKSPALRGRHRQDRQTAGRDGP